MKAFFINFVNIIGIILYMGTAVVLAETKKHDELKEWAQQQFELIDLASDKKLTYSRYFQSAKTDVDRGKWSRLAHEVAKKCKVALDEYHDRVSKVPVEELIARDIRPSIRHTWCETQSWLD